jgi:hypothetical protein
VTIGVAVGKDKVDSIIAAARGGYFNQLVTDPSTAAAILDSPACTTVSPEFPATPDISEISP